MVQELLQQIQKAVEQDKKNELLIIGMGILVYSMKFFFTAFPESKVLHSYFPFDKQLMTKPAYADYGADCMTYVIIFMTFAYVVPKYRELIFILALAFAGYTFEFVFIYNDPISKFYPFKEKIEWLYLPLGYSTLAWSFLISIFIYIYCKK